VFDLSEFATLNLDKLRANLIVRRINGSINVIADRIQLREPSEAVEVAVKRFSQGIAPRD
jgi:hypothetical protein